MPDKTIIGLAGKKRCGKDTVARYLVNYKGFLQDSFAAPIRDFVGRLCGYTPDQLERLKEERHPMFGVSPREMMQTLGTEWGRDRISQTIWLDSLVYRVGASIHSRIVISDVRFENEAEAIRSMGGTIIHLGRNTTEVVDTHASEAGIYAREEDFYIPNNSSFQDLYNAVEEVLNEVLYK